MANQCWKRGYSLQVCSQLFCFYRVLYLFSFVIVFHRDIYWVTACVLGKLCLSCVVVPGSEEVALVMLLLASEPLRWYCILLTSQHYYRQQRLLFTTCNVMLYQLMMSLVSCRVVILLTEMKKQAERTRKKRCSQIAKIQQTHIKLQCHKINPSEIQTNTRKKMKWQFQSYIDKIRWHTTNYVNFSTIKKTAMLEKDSTKLRSNVITQWAVTNHMLFRL